MSDGYVTQVKAKMTTEQGTELKTMDMVSLRDFKPVFKLELDSSMKLAKMTCCATAADFHDYVVNYSEQFKSLPNVKILLEMTAVGLSLNKIIGSVILDNVTINEGATVNTQCIGNVCTVSTGEGNLIMVLAEIPVAGNVAKTWMNFNTGLEAVASEERYKYSDPTGDIYSLSVSEETVSLDKIEIDKSESFEEVIDPTLAPLPEFPTPPNEE